MSRDFIVTPPVEQDEEAEYIITLPIHRKLAIQARQSKKRQAMYNKESYEYQTRIMLQRAIKLGWVDEDIILLIENKRKDGTLVDASGTKRIDQRPTMQDIWGYIERDEIGAVMTRAVDRLFRHINMIEPAQFADHCKRHNVIILTEKQRFDFNKRPEDTKRFLAEAQAGADYISGHIAMMNRYRREKALRGEYDGRNVAIGFMLDEERLYFIVYEPHARIVVWIFRRFKELSGNFAALYKELAALPFVFPFFPDGVNHSVTLGNNGQGYTITPRGLRELLCNVSYIGWWLVTDRLYKTAILPDGREKKVLEKQILRAKIEHNHPAIVDELDFWYAHDLLNPEAIDKNTRERFNKKGTIPADALLNGIVTSDSPNRVYVNQRADKPEKALYTIINYQEYGVDREHGSVYVQTLDTIFTDHLLAKLEEGKRLRAIAKDTVIEGELDYLEDTLIARFTDAAQAAQQSSLEFEKKLKDYREEAASIEHTLHYGASKLPGETIVKFAEDLSRLYVSIEQLEMKKKRAQVAQAELQEFVEKLDDIPAAWAGMGTEKQRRFIRLVTDKITLTKPAPNWLLLDITWLVYDEWHQSPRSLFYIWQIKSQHAAWTEEENSIMYALYPTTDRAAVLEALPRRNWYAIFNQALRLGIRRKYQWDNSPFPKFLSVDDAAFMAEMGLELETLDQCVWYREGIQDNDTCSTIN